jgi:hypothetical protein
MRWPWTKKPSNLVARWEQSAQKLLVDLESHTAYLEDVQGQLESLSSKLSVMASQVRDDVKRSEEIQRQHAVALDSLRDELAVAEATIQTQELHNKLIQSRIETDIAVQTGRAILLTSKEESE